MIRFKNNLPEGSSLSTLELFIVLVGFPLTSGVLQQGLMIALIFLCVIQAFMYREIKIDRCCLYTALMFVLWLLFVEFRFGDGISRIIQTITFLCVLLVSSMHEWEKSELVLVRDIFLLYILSWGLYFFKAPSFYGFQAYLGNSNALGAMALNALVFLVITPLPKTKQIFAVAIDLFFLFVSSSRAALISVIISFVVFLFLKQNERKEKLRIKLGSSFFVFTVIISMVISFIYPNLLGTVVGEKLNSILMRYTGKGLFTGRQDIWKYAINEIRKSPLIGLGNGFNLKSIVEDGRSIHNLYLQTTLQTGWIGLLLLVLFLYSILRVVLHGSCTICTIICSVMIGVLVHELFEVSLTQNNWHYGFVFWFVFGIGISSSRAVT